VTIPLRYAVRSTANPQPQTRLRGALYLLRSFVNMQASWKCRKPQTSLEAVLILLYNYMTIPSRYAVRSTANPHATEKAEKLH